MANANIFSQFAAPRSIADYQGDAQRREANALTLEGVKRKNAMEDMALQQSTAKRNALMQIAQGWTPQTTVQERVTSLRANPEFWAEADALEKADIDAKKTRGEIDAKAAETAGKNHDLFKASLGLIASNPTPETVEAVLANLQQKVGEGDAGAGRQLFAGAQTPEQIRERAMRIGLALDKQLPQMQTNDAGGFVSGVAIDPVMGKPIQGAGFTTQKTQSPDNLASNTRQAADAAAGRAVQIRGQDLVNQRASEGTWTMNNDTGYMVNSKTGAYKLATGPDGTPTKPKAKTTEGERTAGALLQRMRSSQLQLEAALRANPDAATPNIVANGLRMIGADAAANGLTSEARQQVEAAQLDILDAALTLGTGAAYTKEQLEGYRRSYFPQINDDEATIRDKQVRLQNILQAAEVKAGGAAVDVPTAEEMTRNRQPPAAPAGRTIKRTGKLNGRKVIEYSDGTVEYGN